MEAERRAGNSSSRTLMPAAPIVAAAYVFSHTRTTSTTFSLRRREMYACRLLSEGASKMTMRSLRWNHHEGTQSERRRPQDTAAFH